MKRSWERLLVTILMFVFPHGIALVSAFPWFRYITLFGGMGLVGLYILYRSKSSKRIPPELLLYILYVGWAAITGIIVAKDTTRFLDHASTMIQLAALVLAVGGFAYAFKSSDIPILAVISTVSIVVIYGIVSGDIRFGTTLAIRVTSFLKNPNDLGYYSLLAIIGIAFLWNRPGKRIIKVLSIGLVVMFTFAIVFSGSRKAFIGLLVFLVLWMWFCYRQYIFRRIYAAPLIVLVFAGAYLLIDYVWDSTLLGARFATSFESENFLGTSRTEFYKEGIDFFLEKPITGIGLGNFAVYSWYEKYSHSDYMEVLSTTGLVGAVLYFPIYIILWSRIWRLRKRISPDIAYQFGVIKALILVLLVLAVGRINSQSIMTMYMLAGMIGYTFFIENRLKIMKPNKLSLKGQRNFIRGFASEG